MRIETVAYQEALRANVRKMMQEQDIYIPGLEKGIKPRNKKSERLFSLVPMFARGQFFFRTQDLEAQKEFLSYPKGKHDDIMDSVWIALEGAKPCRKKELTENTQKGVKKYFDWMTM